MPGEHHVHSEQTAKNIENVMLDREMMELLTVLHGLRQTNTDVRGSCVSWMETVVLS